MKDFVTKANKTGGDDSGIATKQGAFEQNSLNDENKNVVETAGLTPTSGTGSDPTPTQLAESINIYAQTGHDYQDSGVANAYTLTATGTLQQPTSYVDGQRITFTTSNENTGASTINVSSIGVKSVVTPLGSALSGGEIRANERTEIIYNLSNDNFELMPWNLGVLRSQIVTFTTSGTYNKLDGLLFIIVEGVGGGGGGGGSAACGSNETAIGIGGGGGGYSKRLILASELSPSESVTVGSGGTGGTTGVAAGDGGATSFGSFITSNGGLGGALGNDLTGSYTVEGQVGSTATGGDVNIRGGASDMVAAITALIANSSEGGDSMLGVGGRAPAGGNAGNAGTDYGSGGSGSASNLSTGPFQGGAGADGILIITEFYGV